MIIGPFLIHKIMGEKKESSYVRLIWECSFCRQVLISYSNKRHEMDVCNCGKSGVDLEEFYQRDSGYPVELHREIIKEK